MRKLLAFFLLLLPSVAAAEVKPEAEIWLPRDVSLEGHRIDSLINVTSIFVVLLFVTMCIWLAITMIKHRSGRTADYDHGNSKHHVMVALGLSAAIFLIVDGNLFVNSMLDLNQAFWAWERTAGPEVVRIEINARQWAWEARYAGPDGEFATQDDIVTLNDIRVPIDTPVAIQMASVDVIHSFYLPNLRVKTDAVPGTINRLWFQVDGKRLAEAPGNEFDLACAQHCGTHHYKMKGKLTAYSKEAFQAWSREASAMSSLDYDKNDQPAKTQAHWGWKWQERI
jgi:cytochrome c oxidase subunit II